ncbi:hypothetical protein B0J13DRAFT_108720 [Dactylonectria estremocensis]|uniref:Uncharacterized protein n=1 Tax=Dactylonectria estremocensis TaxID=1079267 RepID=A0A9P9FAM6_9HYPO|nr:hypothetical protein B0J13DRAFT_108720 [Dactylonectria estremocensis]
MELLPRPDVKDSWKSSHGKSSGFNWVGKHSRLPLCHLLLRRHVQHYHRYPPLQITMDGKQASKFFSDIKADILVPMHYES